MFIQPIRTHEDGEKKGGKDFTVDIFTVPGKIYHLSYYVRSD